MRFLAAIHGAEVKGEEKGGETPEGPIFKDPEQYEGLSEEEKEAETERMKGQLQNVLKDTPLG